jgi:hypothetical protein
MNRMQSPAMIVAAISVGFLTSMAVAAQDRFTLKVPNGLSFSEFKGCDTWQNVSVSQTETGLKIIAANDTMINAFRSGVPGNGKPFPEGSQIVKIEWAIKDSPESPYFVRVPGALKSVSFIEKNTQRFPDSGGWGYAQFHYEAAADTFRPVGEGSACGHACHTAVKTNDYIFTAYPPR